MTVTKPKKKVLLIYKNSYNSIESIVLPFAFFEASFVLNWENGYNPERITISTKRSTCIIDFYLYNRFCRNEKGVLS